jgi:hypothetical protein
MIDDLPQKLISLYHTYTLPIPNPYGRTFPAIAASGAAQVFVTPDGHKVPADKYVQGIADSFGSN